MTSGFASGTVAVSFFLFTALGVASGLQAQDLPEIVKPTSKFNAAEKYEAMSGGAATTRKTANSNAFSHSSANLSLEQEMRFKIGNGFFRRLWVSAPSSTTAADGLGPLFNARSCQRCHLKDGRGHPPQIDPRGDDAVSMFLRLSIPPQTDADRAALASGRKSVIDEPTYGGQFQDFSIQGHKAEGRMRIAYEEVPALLADGETVRLRKPAYAAADLAYGPMHENVMLSPRVAPPMIGIGLLEAVAEEDIVALADPKDTDGDGISGRVNRVWSPKLGRCRGTVRFG